MDYGASSRVLEVDGDQGDVVFLGAASSVARPAGDLLQEGGGEMVVRFEGLLKGGFSEFFLRGIHRFQDSIRVEQATITVAEWNFRCRVGGFQKEAEHEAVFFDLPHAVGARG